jgi:hypothetical protein
MSAPVTKISLVRACAHEGDWEGALRICARFPRLGDKRGAILAAHACLTRSGRSFYQQIGKDPDLLVEEGIAAIKEQYCE